MTYTIFDYIGGRDIRTLNLEEDRKRSLLTLNSASWFLLAISLFNGFGFVYFGIKSLAAFNFLHAFVLLTIIVFSRYYYRKLFKSLFILSFNFVIILYSCVLGPESSLQTFLIISIGWIYLLFEGEDRFFRVVGFGLTLFSFFILEITDYGIFTRILFSPNFYDIIKYNILFSSLIFNWLIVRSFYSNKGKYEMRTKNLLSSYAELNEALILREKEIQRRADEYKLLSDNASDIIGFLDPQMKIMFVSPSIKTQLSYDVEDVIDRDLADLFHEKDRHLLNYFNFMAKLEKGETIRTQAQIINREGNYRWFQTLFKPIIENDQVQRIQFTSRIIEEEKRLELLLQETQSLAHMGGWELNVASGEFYWTDEVRKIHEVGDNHLPTLENEVLFFEPESRPVFREAIAKACLDNSSFDLELALITGLGNKKWVRVLGRPSNAKGKPYKISGLFHDITEQKIIEKEIVESKEKAEKATRAKSDFLSVMSHEIRTPMNAVIGFTHLLIKENPKKEQLENLKALRFSANHLMALINDILDFSKIESGRIEFDRVQFKLLEIITGIHHSLGVKAEEKEIDFILDTPPKLPHQLIGDQVRLNQILINIIGNAIKFTNSGHVKLKVTTEKPLAGRQIVNFEVSDTGIGIDKDKIDTIFDQFTQESSETTRAYGGTGLGLSITKRLIELQGGSISVESQKGLGSKFTVTMSFDIGEVLVDENETSAPKYEEKTLSGALKILLVEDNKVNQMIARKFIEKGEVSLEIANNGMEAVEAIKKKGFNLVLMDLQMPVMDGYEATRQIRSMDDVYFQNIPIIALTAAAFSEVRDEVLSTGMNDFVTKPFNPVELFGKIEKYTSQSANHKE